jgi:hypothetical protein
MATLTSATIAAANTFTTPVRLTGYFNVSVSGTISSGTTVTAQRSPDNSNWYDVDSWTAAAEAVGYEPEYLWYRVGCKTAQFTGGDSVVIRVGATSQQVNTL